MDRRIKHLILIIVSIIALSLILYWSLSSKNELNKKNYRNFAYQDFEFLDSIVIKSFKNQSTLTNLANGKWQLNNQSLVNSKKIEALKVIVENLKVKSIVPHNQSDSLNKQIENHIEVILFKDGERVKNFVLLAPTKNNQDAYMFLITEERDTFPVINYLIGKPIDIYKSMSPNPNYWRNNTLIYFSDLLDIKEVKVFTKKDSTHIIQKNNQFYFHKGNELSGNEILTLKEFQKIDTYQYIDAPKKIAEIQPSKIFEIQISNGSKKTTLAGFKKSKDLNKLYILHNNQWSIALYTQFDIITNW